MVISNKPNSQIEKYVKQGKIQFKKTKLNDASFLSKYKPYLVMATTSDKILNRKIVEKAKRMKSYAYASDDIPNFFAISSNGLATNGNVHCISFRISV